MRILMNIQFFSIIILLTFFLTPESSEQPLLKIGHNSQCIKKVIDDFIKKQTCQKLQDSQKTILAIKMTNCLNEQMGKAIIIECSDLKKCKIQGDDWNTFTSFLTHIDNLCHFYWDLLHHERTGSLIDGLSQSAHLAEDILKKNYKQTQNILSTQASIQESMDRSLASNEKLSNSLIESEQKLQNITQGIQQFLNKMNENIFSQYSYLLKAVETINQGMEGINTFNSFLVSQINSMSGILYFLVSILALGFLTSFRLFQKYRNQNFCILAINIFIQLTVPNCFLVLVGIKNIRIIFFVGQTVNLAKAFVKRKNEIHNLKNEIDGRLSTKRLKRIFKQLIKQEKLAISDQKEQIF